MDYIKHRALDFRSRNHIKNTVTLKSLTKIARQNGYIVYNYSATQTLMLLLDVYDDSLTASSVSTKDSNGNIIIFIDDSAPKDKRLFGMAHELGHIILEHKPVTDKKLKRRQENEANKFAHCILSKHPFPFDAVTVSLAACIILLLTLISVLLITPTNSDSIAVDVDSNNSSTHVSSDAVSYPSVSSATDSVLTGSNGPVCYYTKHGSVYHTYRDCTYLDAAANVYETTIDNCPAHELCSRCRKRKSNFTYK